MVEAGGQSVKEAGRADGVKGWAQLGYEERRACCCFGHLP